MTFLLILAGLVLLTVGGEALVRGSVSAAKALGVSPLLIGLTLVGFGTSTPELTTSVVAAMEEAPGIAVGNVVGSNTANIFFILGLAALISPLVVDPKAFRRDGVAMLAAALACCGAALLGTLERWVGVAFLATLIGYILWAYRSERRSHDAEAEMHEHVVADVPPGPRSVALSVLIAIVGIALTVVGASLLVSGAIDLAKGLGVSDSVIGLTVVAVGTSLPELVGSVIAAVRKHSDVALGNIIGSNIYNVFGILGVTAIIHPVDVPPEIVRLDIWVMLAATLLLIAFVRTGWRLSRAEGAIFLLAYIGYIGWIGVNA
jgi:cation:H+ antiporter